MANIYKSKYTGAEIDALLDKVNDLTNIQANVDEDATTDLRNIKIGNVVYNISSQPITKRTITYQYSKEFNNGGTIGYGDSIVYKKVEYDVGAPITPEPLPVLAGYNATNWEILPDVMPDNNLTVNCIMLLNYYEANFYTDGVLYSSYRGKYTMPIEYPSAPSKTGFTFNGWTPSGVLNMPINGVTFNAQFVEKPAEKVNVTFRSREQYYSPSTGANAQYTNYETNSTVSYDKGTVFNNSSAIYNQYGAVTGKYKSLETDITFPYTLNNDIVIDITYLCNSYTATFKIDGSTVAVEEFPYTFPVYPSYYPDTSKEGYTFNGWDNIITSMPASDVDINGSYTASSYTLTLKARTESFETGSSVKGSYSTVRTISVDYGYVIEDANALRALYTDKAGYAISIDTTLSYPYTVTGSRTVNATYDCLYYTVTFDTSTGDLISTASYPNTYPTSQIPKPTPPDLSEYNYYFVDWGDFPGTYIDNNCTVTANYEYVDPTLKDTIYAGTYTYYSGPSSDVNVDVDLPFVSNNTTYQHITLDPQGLIVYDATVVLRPFGAFTSEAYKTIVVTTDTAVGESNKTGFLKVYRKA